jgi:carnitine O-acetyltransferase
MALSLDHISHTFDKSQNQTHPRSQAQSALDAHLHSIRGISTNIANRFSDKPFTVLVDPLARAGATGEHSHCDALVPSIVAEYGIVQGVEKEAFSPPDNYLARTGPENGCSRVDWVADTKLWRKCEEAERRSVALIEDSDDSVFWFDEYGTDWIKEVGTERISSTPNSKLTDL